MLRDITIGQHLPGNSPLHRLDPRLKLLLTLAFIVILFVGTNPLGILLSLLFLVFCYAIAKIPAKMMWKSMKPLLPIIAVTAILNLLFIPGQAVFSFWIIKITYEGIRYAILLAVRIVALILGASLLTYTTSPIVLTDAIERLLSPLAKLHFPAHELAMMMTIALRFVPTLVEETDKIMSAQKARGAELDNGSLVQRVKALVPVLIPLFLSAFRRADELALAMECRCYHGGEGRTRLRQLHIGGYDVALSLVAAAYFTLIGFSGPIFTWLWGLLA